MNVKKCDICGDTFEYPSGSKFEDDTIVIFKHNKRGYVETSRTYDTCPNCINSFNNWFAEHRYPNVFTKEENK